MKVPFVGGMDVSDSIPYDNQLCVNLYLENEPGKEPGALQATPGLRSEATFTPTQGAGCRGLWTTSTGRLFVVFGDTLYERTAYGTSTTIGTLTTFEGPVKMADNTVELILVDGTQGYTVDYATTTLTAIADADFQDSATQVQFLDQYFIVNQPDTFNFWISAIADGTSWNALDFGTAEYQPDSIRALQTLNNTLWVFCENSTEVFYNNGNADFPFQRIQGATLDVGTLAADSVAKGHGRLFWLGSDEEGFGQVFRSNGNQAERISDHGIEEILLGFSVNSGAVGYTYQQRGHSFYVLNFLNEGRTLVWDDTTMTWHERSHRDSTTGAAERHQGVYQAFWNGKNYIGDISANTLYSFDPDYYFDNTDLIRRVRRTPVYHNDRKMLYYSKFEIDGESGVGNDRDLTSLTGTITLTASSAAMTGSGTAFNTELTAGDVIFLLDDTSTERSYTIASVTDATNAVLAENSASAATAVACSTWNQSDGYDPSCELRWSDDGGRTWSNYHSVKMGKKGEYSQRMIWRRLGRSRERVFEWSCTEPVKVWLYGATVDAQVGD